MPARQTFDRTKVAAIVLEAIELGLPLVTTVEAVTGCTTNQARHMIRSVRSEGHLGAIPHYPARATIHRGAQQAKSWVVCEHCTTAWPCPGAYPYSEPANQRGPEPDEQRAQPRRRRRARRAGTAER